MVLTTSVVYRHVFTHNSYGYSSSIRLIADCERQKHNIVQTHPGTNIHFVA